MSIIAPILFAIFAWWFSTGLLLFVVRLIDRREGFPSEPKFMQYCSVIGSLPVFIFGLYLFHNTLNSLSPTSIYLAFISALIIWGWLEFAFMCGVVTGTNSGSCVSQLSGWERFRLSFLTICYSEIAIGVTFMWLITFGISGQNYFGLLAFSVLFFARLSAKLNIFFGVPFINFEFLPSPIQHIATYFCVRKVTAMFPISITLMTCAAFFFLGQLFNSTDNGTSGHIGYSLVLALTILALVEHWFMVLPLPDSKLWTWMLPGNSNLVEKPRSQTVI